MPRKKKLVEAEETPQKKTAAAPPKKKRTTFSLRDAGRSFLDAANQVATELNHRKKNRHGGFMSLSQIRRDMTPLPSFAWQWLFASYGLQHKKILELIGPEHVGKSTMINMLLGQAMIYDEAPCLYMTGDGKPMESSRVARIIHPDPVIGKEYADMITYKEAHVLHEMDENLTNWVATMRGKAVTVAGGKDIKVPYEVPLIVVVEHLGKLLSEGEALGYYDYADYKSAANNKKLKKILEGSNLEHSRFAAGFMRRMQMLLETENVFMIVSSHQNESIDMSGGGASYLPKEYKELRNKSKNCGRALNQSASYQVIMIQSGTVKGYNDEIVGKRIKMRIDKNSFGPCDREIFVELRHTHYQDTDGRLERVYFTHEWVAKFLAEKKHLGVTATDKKFTCKSLGIISGSAEELVTAFLNDADAVAYVAKTEQMFGYSDIADQIRRDIAEQGAEVPQPPQPPAEEGAAEEDSGDESQEDSGESENAENQ